MRNRPSSIKNRQLWPLLVRAVPGLAECRARRHDRNELIEPNPEFIEQRFGSLRSDPMPYFRRQGFDIALDAIQRPVETAVSSSQSVGIIIPGDPKLEQFAALARFFD
jgi:hypothetical protein